jgi:hypothetical protein
MARPHRVPIDAFGGDLPTAAALQRLVDPEDQRALRREGRHQELQQHATGRQAGPAGGTENAVVAMELPRLGQAHGPQGGRDGAVRGGEDRPGQQHLGMAPDAAGEQGRKRRQRGYDRGR